MLPDPYLSDLMKAHHFSIVSMGSTTGEQGSSSGEQLALPTAGPKPHRRDIHLQMRRDVVCETCGRAFDYTFDCTTGITVYRGHRTFDVPALTSALERQLRRRIHCPYCHAVQGNVRRAFVRREFRHTVVGLGALTGTVVGAGGLSVGGYVIGGILGLTAGLALSIGLVLILTRWMLMQLLDPVQS